jgi:hypothetical protein
VKKIFVGVGFVVALAFFAVGAAGIAQADSSAARTIRCSTSNARGNFSVFIGSFTADALTGTLFRGVALDQGPLVETFSLSLTPPVHETTVPPTVAFQLEGSLTMSQPYQNMTWDKPRFVAATALLSQSRGGLVETGVLRSSGVETPYRLLYRCIAVVR